MIEVSDEELIRDIKNCESEVSTLAEIHKALIQNQIKCGINDLRQRILSLHRDGYIGNELASDDINMYYIIFNPNDPIEVPEV